MASPLAAAPMPLTQDKIQVEPPPLLTINYDVLSLYYGVTNLFTVTTSFTVAALPLYGSYIDVLYVAYKTNVLFLVSYIIVYSIVVK